MQIIVDTREQLPLEFAVPTVREALVVGDYRALFADGSLSAVVFERKSINDLFGTLSKGYERFKQEINRAGEGGISLKIIVEGSLSRVLQGTIRSQRTPISIVYQLFTIRIRYGIETIFCKNREEMSQYITHYFLALERENNDSRKSITVQIPGVGPCQYTGD